MADQRRRRRYRTDGSVAYQPEVEQEPVVPSRQEQRRVDTVHGNTVRRPEPDRRPRIVPRRRPAARPDVQVRAQSAVSPFAVVGLFSVLACTLVLVVSMAQLAVVNNDIVELRGELSSLQDESWLLQARYELEFDLEAIEKMFLSDGSMVRAGTSQTVYLDLSAPDSVVYYNGAEEGLPALLQRAEQYLDDLLS